MTKETKNNPVVLRLEIHKGKVIPKNKKGAKVYKITKATKQATINEACSYYKTLAEYNDVTLNGAIQAKAVFASADIYQRAVMAFANLVVEYKINPLKYYDGINLMVAVELERLRMAGHDLRDHFRGPQFTPLDVLADAPGIIQNATGSEVVH